MPFLRRGSMCYTYSNVGLWCIALYVAYGGAFLVLRKDFGAWVARVYRVKAFPSLI